MFNPFIIKTTGALGLANMLLLPVRKNKGDLAIANNDGDES